jgi:hypothetical protein
MSIERYEAEPVDGYVSMQRVDGGEWVRYDDYTELEEQLAESGNIYAYAGRQICEHIDRIAELEAELAARDWQPIETAPEKTTFLVVNTKGQIYTCRLPVVIKCNSQADTDIVKRVRYTHWHPLPPKPESDNT